MPETILVSKPAELVEAGEFHALVDRVDKVEAKVSQQQHAMFGFQRTEDNVWVDGVLQNLADLRRQQARFVTYFIKIGLPLIALGSLSVFGNFLHNQGADAAIGTFLHAFLNIPNFLSVLPTPKP